MSRNNKGARLVAQRKAITAMHKNGNKGPSKTQPKHGKRWTYRSNPIIQKSIAEALKASKVEGRGPAKTSGAAILAKAGGAAKFSDED